MLLIRCDASTEIGAGHFFRELALAEVAIDHGIPVLMAMHRPAVTFGALAAANGIELLTIDAAPGSPEDAEEICKAASKYGAKAVVVDGYHFPTVYYNALCSSQFVLAAVDDVAHQYFPVDILINANINAHRLRYEVRSDTLQLLGVRYVMLRRQFQLFRESLEIEIQPSPAIQNLFVMLGGGDLTNETERVLRALAIAGYNQRLDVVIGPSNPHQASIAKISNRLDATVSIHQDVREMAHLMDRHDLAICGGGQSTWELACIGVPALQIIVADNQTEVVRELHHRGITYCLGFASSLTITDIAEQFRCVESQVPLRKAMRHKGMTLIDGNGAERVLKALF